MKRCDKKGQVGYTISVLLVLIGLAFFGLVLIQQPVLTGEIISDPNIPIACSDVSIENTWDSVFQEDSGDILIVTSDDIIGERCSEYFAYKIDTTNENLTYLLYGYTREILDNNVTYIQAEKINATQYYINLLNGVTSIDDVDNILVRDEAFLEDAVFFRAQNISSANIAEEEFDSIFLTNGVTLIEDNLFEKEIFSFTENLSNDTLESSYEGFVIGNYSYSFFMFTSTSITLEDYPLDCITNLTCENWGNCSENIQNRTCINSSECAEDDIFIEFRNCEISCIPNWTISEWSDCVGGLQIRTVNDVNACGNDTNKPLVNQTCFEERCESSWTDCGEWEPAVCPRDGVQTQFCGDINDCGDPDETISKTRSCTPTSSNWFFILIVFIIISFIIFVILWVVFLMKKKSDEEKGLGVSQFSPRPPPMPFIAKKLPQQKPILNVPIPTTSKISTKPIVKKYPTPKPIQRSVPPSPQYIQNLSAPHTPQPSEVPQRSTQNYSSPSEVPQRSTQNPLPPKYDLQPKQESPFQKLSFQIAKHKGRKPL